MWLYVIKGTSLSVELQTSQWDSDIHTVTGVCSRVPIAIGNSQVIHLLLYVLDHILLDSSQYDSAYMCYITLQHCI